MTTPKKYASEAALTKAILRQYDKLPYVVAQKVHGSAYGKPTLDIVGSCNGRLFWLEVKQPGGKPTPRQFHTMHKWRERGAIATWTTTIEGAMSLVSSTFCAITREKQEAGFHGESDLHCTDDGSKRHREAHREAGG